MSKARKRQTAAVYVDGKRAYVGPKSHAEGFAKMTRQQMRERGEQPRGRVVVK